MKMVCSGHLNKNNLLRVVKIAALMACISLLAVGIKPVVATNFIVEDGLIKLGNTYYEIAVSTTDGSIAYLLDKSTGQKISDGNDAGNLWTADLDHGTPITSKSYTGQFKYIWDAANNTLTLTYTGNTAVTVTIVASDSQWLKMQATIVNNTAANIASFSFPNDLRVVSSDIADGLLPMLPGALLSAKFFPKGTYVNEYPGAMFADYLSIRSSRGKIALYSQKGPILQPVYIGYARVGADSPYTKITHQYQTWVTNTKTWVSPAVIIRIGQEYKDTILSYRTDNGIDNYKSLTTKLGKLAQAYFSAPMYKLDLGALHQTFADLKSSVIDKINVPGMIHFVAVQNGGHDKGYPDFIPPDPQWGSTSDFADLVNAIHNKNGIVVPYTNFSWWDNNGPTLLNLPAGTALTDVAVEGIGGSIDIEKYGPHVGLVMNLHNALVKNKIAEQHTALMKTIGVDGILEDQWGERNAPYDFNPAGLDSNDPATSYFEGVLDHYRAQASSHLMTESGVDVLADDGVGFMGTSYLRDILGARGATASFTTYYPMAGMLLRDKVLLYQHDLAAETWTKNKEMLRWNLTQGYNLSNAFFDQTLPGLNMANPWLNLVGIFQKYALSNYADELVGSYDDLGNGVKRTVFATYQVYSNWNTTSSYSISGNTLPPGGIVTQANDGSVTAGVFTHYNGNALSDGDHYLVETRSPSEIKIFQPIGPDSELHIHILDGENRVTAYQYDGTPISGVMAVITGNDLSFNYAGTVNNQTVGFYQITR